MGKGFRKCAETLFMQFRYYASDIVEKLAQDTCKSSSFYRTHFFVSDFDASSCKFL